MTDKERNLIEVGNFHVIYSTKTNKPYIDEEGCCYILESTEEAKAFVKECPQTSFDKKTSLSQKVYCNDFFSYGIKRISLKKINAEPILIDIKREDLRTNFFLNEKCVYNSLMLMETEKKKYLRGLKENKLYAPVIIDVRMTKQYPKIHYCNATINSNPLLVLFTTLQAFDEWNIGQENIWKPMEVTLANVAQERKTNDVIIDPLTLKLIIPGKYIASVLKEKESKQ